MPRLLMRRDLSRDRRREILGQRVGLASPSLLARQPKAHGIIERLSHVRRPRPHLPQQGGLSSERHDRLRAFRLFRSAHRYSVYENRCCQAPLLVDGKLVTAGASTLSAASDNCSIAFGPTLDHMFA
jgi:hypothetical protein